MSFGGCAKAGKSVRVALAEVLNGMTDPQCTGRLTAIMKRINLEDGTEARGVRKVNATQRTYLMVLDLIRTSALQVYLMYPTPLLLLLTDLLVH